MKQAGKTKSPKPTASDRVLDATSLIFAQGNKRTAAPMTDAVKKAFQQTVTVFESLETAELATVLLLHTIKLGERL